MHESNEPPVIFVAPKNWEMCVDVEFFWGASTVASSTAKPTPFKAVRLEAEYDEPKKKRPQLIFKYWRLKPYFDSTEFLVPQNKCILEI